MGLGFDLLITCYVLFQVNAKNLDKNAFWVKAHEEMFEDENIFKGLMENFASKAPGEKQYSGIKISYFVSSHIFLIMVLSLLECNSN